MISVKFITHTELYFYTWSDESNDGDDDKVDDDDDDNVVVVVVVVVVVDDDDDKHDIDVAPTWSMISPIVQGQISSKLGHWKELPWCLCTEPSSGKQQKNVELIDWSSEMLLWIATLC